VKIIKNITATYTRYNQKISQTDSIKNKLH